MKSVIYLDILLLVNFLIGYFLLLAAGRLAGRTAGTVRLLLGASVSALGSLLLLAPSLPCWLSLPVKLAQGAVIVLVCFGWQGLRPFCRVLCWFFLMNLGLAGLVLLSVFRGGFQGMEVNNLSVYINLSPSLLVLAVLSLYALTRTAIFLFGGPAAEGLWDLRLILPGGRQSELSAFYDTGFFLKDPLGGGQLLLVSWPGVKADLSDEVNRFLGAYFSGDGVLPPEGLAFRLVPCRYAGASALLPGFQLPEAILSRDKHCCTAHCPTVVLCPEPLGDGSFCALFGSEFLHSETKRRQTICT